MSSISPTQDLGLGIGPHDPVVGPCKPRLLGFPNPGMVTEASDDDPSGIVAYSQAGARLDFSLLWIMLFSYPLMEGTREIRARIGRTKPSTATWPS